jgi:hypothetical protein
MIDSAAEADPLEGAKVKPRMAITSAAARAKTLISETLKRDAPIRAGLVMAVFTALLEVDVEVIT